MSLAQTILTEIHQKYDFLRFTFVDIHGISRSKTVSRSAFAKCLKSGIAAYVGSLGFGLRGELEPANSVHRKQAATGYEDNGNLVALPILDTLHPLPLSGSGRYRVGQFFCETFHDKATQERQLENPRYLARKHLEKLQGMGYTLFSSYEFEFSLNDPTTLAPVFTNFGEIFCNQTMNKYEHILYEVGAVLESIGVEIETLQTEYAEGQFEIVLKPQIGIKIADNAILLKDCVKQVARKHGLKAIFMTTMNSVHACNGFHFNHSLRKLDENNDVSAFSDVTKQDLLSDVFRHWMGGLNKHFRALVPLGSPTFNCYRRLAKPWAPSCSDWGIDNRMAAYRVKNMSPESTYIESRIPGGSANPYLVLASHVAAGIDGLISKLPCPPPLRRSTTESNTSYQDIAVNPVPMSLKEGLEALRADEYMVEAMGQDFVTWFSAVKQLELEELKDCDISKEDGEMYKKERDLFMELL